MGTGASWPTIPAIAEALTVVALDPKNCINVVRTLLCTVTRIKLTGSEADNAAPGAALAGGKSTLTVSAEVPNPLLDAYTQGVRASELEQVNEPDVANAAAFPAAEFVPSKILMIPAWAAASAAAWAICLWE